MHSALTVIKGPHPIGGIIDPPLISACTGSHGLLAINHEYTDDGLLHPDGMQAWSPDKVRKSQAAHGVSVIEVRRRPDGSWDVARPSRYGRRITARTPMRLSGPAAGHPWLRMAADPTGVRVLGTLNNCGCAHPPWGTYLTCEENFHVYFHHAGEPDAVSAWPDGGRPRSATLAIRRLDGGVVGT